MINHNKKNNIISYVKGALILGISLVTLNLVKDYIDSKIPTFANNLETRLEQSARINYIEMEKNGKQYVLDGTDWYEVIETRFVKDRGLDYLVGLEGVKYTPKQKNLNSQYNKDHRVEGIPQPGDSAYVLNPTDNP